MKRLVSVVLLAMSIPAVAFADGSLMVQSRGGAVKDTSSGPKGVLFHSSFNGPHAVENAVSVRTTANSRLLSGLITGTYEGISVGAKSVESKVSGGMPSGSLALGTVPEPGTLGLLGTGLLAIAGLVRRRLRAKATSSPARS
jgi:PEP-CTERM motif